MIIGVNTRVLLSSRMEGVCRYIHETLRRMVRSNPKDQFYFFFDRSYDPQFIYAENVTPIILSPPTRHPFLWYWWFEWSIPKALKKYKIDVFYSGDTFMSLKTQVPTVLVSHDIAYAHFPKHIPFLYRKYYEHYFPLYHKKAEKVLTVSSFTKKDVIEKYSLNPNKLEVAYNSVKEGMKPLSQESIFEVQKRYSKGKQYFLYVGAIHPRKNVSTLIKAFDQFKTSTGSDKKLILIARLAWNTESFSSAFANAKHKKDIIHLSEMYNEEVNDITASAFAMVYVSLFEGFGLPILEAMQCNVPVICSDKSSMPEVCGNAGYTVDPKNISQISEAMTLLENDEGLRVKMIEAGKNQKKKFDWDSTARITYEAIKSVSKT